MDGVEIPESSDEWEHIQSPFLHIPPPPKSISKSETQTQTQTVVIEDHYLLDGSSVFPPSHHEGLQIPQNNPQPLHPNPSLPSSSISSSSSSSPLPFQSESRRSRVLRLASIVRNYAVCGGGFWAFMSLAGVLSAVFMSILYVKVNRWRIRWRIHQENKDPLGLLIKQKDEKINQLMLQIAQMNQVLSARRKVPVLRMQ